MLQWFVRFPESSELKFRSFNTSATGIPTPEVMAQILKWIKEIKAEIEGEI